MSYLPNSVGWLFAKIGYLTRDAIVFLYCAIVFWVFLVLASLLTILLLHSLGVLDFHDLWNSTVHLNYFPQYSNTQYAKLFMDLGKAIEFHKASGVQIVSWDNLFTGVYNWNTSSTIVQNILANQDSHNILHGLGHVQGNHAALSFTENDTVKSAAFSPIEAYASANR